MVVEEESLEVRYSELNSQQHQNNILRTSFVCCEFSFTTRLASGFSGEKILDREITKQAGNHYLLCVVLSGSVCPSRAIVASEKCKDLSVFLK